MLASLLILADAAEEGRKVVLAMLVVGLIFIAVIALGELTHYLAVKRKARTPTRTLSARLRWKSVSQPGLQPCFLRASRDPEGGRPRPALGEPLCS